jgi:ribosomal protein S25
MPAATISIPLSACVLKPPVWRTEFVTTHTLKSAIALKVSAENNLIRESLTEGIISKCYKNVIHWLKGHTLGVKLIVTSCAGNVLRSAM